MSLTRWLTMIKSNYQGCDQRARREEQYVTLWTLHRAFSALLIDDTFTKRDGAHLTKSFMVQRYLDCSYRPTCFVRDGPRQWGEDSIVADVQLQKDLEGDCAVTLSCDLVIRCLTLEKCPAQQQGDSGVYDIKQYPVLSIILK